MQGSTRVRRIRGHAQATRSARAGERLRVVGYVRVSTEGQAADGHGLDVQEKAIRAFAESQGYRLLEIASDPGVSGATRPADRPGFRRVLALAAERAFDVLLVAKIDRLSRDVRHAITTVSELAEQHEVAFRSVTESMIDTANPMGRTFFAVFAGMAENERFVIRDRTAGGRMQKATEGGYAGGAAPYGYSRDKDGGLVVVEAEAAIVRRIFAEKASGLTLRAICERLDAEGIRPRRGARWHPGRISYMLDNPKYRGAVEYLFRWNGAETHVLREGQHQPILG